MQPNRGSAGCACSSYPRGHQRRSSQEQTQYSPASPERCSLSVMCTTAERSLAPCPEKLICYCSSSTTGYRFLRFSVSWIIATLTTQFRPKKYSVEVTSFCLHTTQESLYGDTFLSLQRGLWIKGNLRHRLLSRALPAICHLHAP